jgi:hypothetical protein
MSNEDLTRQLCGVRHKSGNFFGAVPSKNSFQECTDSRSRGIRTPNVVKLGRQIIRLDKKYINNKASNLDTATQIIVPK